jgi:hypothetical protein
MTITTPSQDRTWVGSVTGEVPAQRTAPPERERPTTTTSRQEPARAPAGAPKPAQVPAGAARPTRVAPARTESMRRRWPAALGGLAAGLTLGTVGAVGAVFALSATTVITTAVPASAVSAASLSPNVSVPGRVLTAFGDGTWQVGVDVEPGTYTTTGAGGPTCRHALGRTRTGARIAEHRGSTTVVLTEADGWLDTAGCAMWTRTG